MAPTQQFSVGELIVGKGITIDCCLMLQSIQLVCDKVWAVILGRHYRTRPRVRPVEKESTASILQQHSQAYQAPNNQSWGYRGITDRPSGFQSYRKKWKLLERERMGRDLSAQRDVCIFP